MNIYDEQMEPNRDVWINRLVKDDRFWKDSVPIISWFFHEYRFLTNYHLQEISYRGKLYPSTEHAYQAMKAIHEFDHETIRLTKSAGMSKKVAMKIQLRPDWEEVKEGIMREVVWIKFNSNDELKQKLLDTGDSYLIEGTVWHDGIWGICIKKDCQKCKDQPGKNLLGKILMETRQKLRENNDDKY